MRKSHFLPLRQIFDFRLDAGGGGDVYFVFVMFYNRIYTVCKNANIFVDLALPPSENPGSAPGGNSNKYLSNI